MSRLLRTYTREELVVYAVNDGETVATVVDHVRDIGATWPILLDSPQEHPNCWRMDVDADSTAEYLRSRIGEDGDGPFPLQIVISADRKLVYFARKNVPEAFFEAVASAVDAAGPPAPLPEVAPDEVAGCASRSGTGAASPTGIPGIVLLALSLAAATARRRRDQNGRG